MEKKKPTGVQYIDNGIYVSSTGVYETTKAETEPAGGFVKPEGDHVKWGTDDNFPQRLIDAVKSDPIAALLEKKIAFHWGRGLMFYNKDVDEKGNEKIRIVPDKDVPPDIKEFFHRNDFKRFMFGIISDFEWWHSYAVQYITNPMGQVLEVKWQRRKNVRCGWRNESTGKMPNYFLGDFPLNSGKKASPVPVFDRNGTRSGLYIHDLPSIDKDYNPDAAWHGITQWLNIAKKIPRWILANIDNSMNLKYHVKVPMEYFLQLCPEEKYSSVEERQAAIKAIQKDTYDTMDAQLAGEKNVNKQFYSTVAVDDAGKPVPGWEIITLENNIQHEAWLRAYGTAAMAMVSGIGLSPSIAGYILPNGLGQGSGSDLREQFNFYIQVMTAIPREITLEPFEFIKRRNGWPEDLHLGYRDVILQSTDQNKSGFATTKESDPTTDKQQDMQLP